MGALSQSRSAREDIAPGRPALALVGDALRDCVIVDLQDSQAFIAGLPALEPGSALIVAERALGLVAVTVVGEADGGLKVRAGVSAADRDFLVAKIARLLSGLS